MNIIELSIAKDYVSDWTFKEAVRELLQNTLDQADKSKTDPIINYNKNNKALIFTNTDTALGIHSLVLGNTSKGDLDRGHFGEGFKLALVVLLRLGHKVIIQNQDEIWLPFFEYSPTYDAVVLKIKITNITKGLKNLSFIVYNVDKYQASEFKQSYILDRNNIIGYKTKYGNILTEQKYSRKVYVGGIYVCYHSMKLAYGYDFNVNVMKLDRDRIMLDSFNIEWEASKMWVEASSDNTKALNETVNFIKNNKSPDYIYNHIGSYGYTKNNDKLNLIDKVAKDFYKEFGNLAYPVTTETERENILKLYDNVIPIITTIQIKDMVKRSNEYSLNFSLLRKRKSLTPSEQVEDILTKYKYSMKEKVYLELSSELLKLAKGWKNESI